MTFQSLWHCAAYPVVIVVMVVTDYNTIGTGHDKLIEMLSQFFRERTATMNIIYADVDKCRDQDKNL